jgi:DNA adenine methylase
LQVTVNSTPRQVLRYPGSKARLAKWIVDLFPRHQSYLEPFAGSGVVFFAKPRCRVEMLNDRDHRIANLFRMMRDRPEELARAVELTPWARVEYEASLTDEGDALERARRFLVRCWQGFNASTVDDSGWYKQCRPLSAGFEPERWLTVPERIAGVRDRLQGVQIESRPALEVIEWARQPEVLIYADPPYLDTEGRYAHTMSLTDHEQLLSLLDQHPGPVVLSGYDHPLYEGRLSGWQRHVRQNQALNCLTRREVVWLNPVAAQRSAQLTLEV